MMTNYWNIRIDNVSALLEFYYVAALPTRQTTEDLMSVITEYFCRLMLENILQSQFVGLAAATPLLD